MREALGYRPYHFPLRDHYTTDQWMYGDAHDKLTESGDWREHIDLTTHRYMREDVEYGLAFLVSVAQWAGVPCPVAAGLLAIGSAVLGRDLRSESPRTLEALGLASLARQEHERSCSMHGEAASTATPVIAALGAGRMGRGIAHVFAYAGHDVRLIDAKPRSAADRRPARARGLGEIDSTPGDARGLGAFDDAERPHIMRRIRFAAATRPPPRWPTATSCSRVCRK